MTHFSDHAPPVEPAKSSRLRTRWAAIGAAVAVSVGAVGVGGMDLVSAEVSTGDRPVFVPITPCRLVDTRPAPNNTGVQPGPMGPKDTYVIGVRGNTDPCPATIPADAVGLSMNVTALKATQQSFLTFWGDGANPGTANLNPAPGQPPVPNAVNTPLGSNGSFQMYNDVGNVEVVIDVNGYYVGHNHDDLYAKVGDAYTKSEVDGSFAKIGNTYDRAQADGRFTQPGEVDNKLRTAAPRSASTGQTACLIDDTDTTGVFEACSDSFVMGATGEHTTQVLATFGWDSNTAGGATGECRLEIDGNAIPDSTINMGETSQSTGNPRALERVTLMANVEEVPGSVNRLTGLHIYTLDCRETDLDMDWHEIQLHVTVFPWLGAL